MATDIRDLILEFIDILQMIVPIIISLGLLYFLWGIVRYLTTTGEGEKGASKNVIVWGLIGLFVMVSIYGILLFLERSFLS